MARLTTIEDVLALETEARGQWLSGLQREDADDLWQDVLVSALHALQDRGTVNESALERQARNGARSLLRRQQREETL